ncbi:MAG: exodeoxyribonuclease VII small subunit [Chitinophagales bacterium]
MENMTFETAFSRLQEIVRKLEDGDLPLQQSLELFEEGVRLFGYCQGELKQAEGKISKLVKALDGEWSTADIEV